MNAELQSVVRSAAVVIGVGLSAEDANDAREAAEFAGLRFRHYQSLSQLLESPARGQCGCVLLQRAKHTPEHELLDDLRATIQRSSQLPVLVWNLGCSAATVIELMRAGAWTVLTDSPTQLSLREQLQQACDFGAELLASSEEQTSAIERMREASDKELEVLEMVMDGLRNKDIAEKLGLTTRAVEDRRIKLMKKLQVDSLPQLIELAVIHRQARRHSRMAGRLGRMPAQDRRFVRGLEIWTPDDRQQRLVLTQSAYRDAQAMEQVSENLSFAMNEGLPGDVWTSRTPVFYRNLQSGPFRRGPAAAASGVTTGIGFPVIERGAVQSIVLMLLDGGQSLRTAVEYWRFRADSGRIELHSGVFANCERLRRLTEQISLIPGKGFAGMVSESGAPALLTRPADDHVETRGVTMHAERMVSGISWPVEVDANGPADVMTLFNSESTPLFRLMQVWDVTSNSRPVLIAEAVDAERSLQSRCETAGRELVADAARLHQLQIITGDSVLAKLSPSQLSFAPSVALVMPFAQPRGRKLAVVLVD